MAPSRPNDEDWLCQNVQAYDLHGNTVQFAPRKPGRFERLLTFLFPWAFR